MILRGLWWTNKGHIHANWGKSGYVEPTRKAAEQGNGCAQFLFGVTFLQGGGNLQDLVQGHMWVNIAAANGVKNAFNLRKLAEKNMTPAQIAEAQKLARECMSKDYKGCGR
jgi:uncharacterized protein